MEHWHQWTEANLCRSIEARPVDNPHGEARVWRLLAEGHAVAYLKQHRVRDKWCRERAILQQLATPPAAPVPELLASKEDGLILLLAVLPGNPAHEAPGSVADQRSLHEQAGRFRRRLDAIPIDDDDPTPVRIAVERRHRAWCERARPHLEPELLAHVDRSLRPDCFDGTTRRWCHRDLAPHNWIVQSTEAGPRLGVIDFGQARPDVWLVDVLKLWDDAWVQAPALADAFWTGYGRRPTEVEQQQLGQLALLHGLATATWGSSHANVELSRHGRAVLRRALREVAS